MSVDKSGIARRKRPVGSKSRAHGEPLRVVSSAPGDTARAQSIDVREERLFRSLDIDNNEKVRRSDLERMLANAGLRPDDIRLRESMTALEGFLRAAEDPAEAVPEKEIPKDSFCKAIRNNILLIERALQGNMMIPDFADFCRDIDQIYETTRTSRSGAPADYIPQLNLKEPEVDQYGVALCTVDGQRYAVGDADVFFPSESTCKPINYCLALEEHGAEAVHAAIGHEPSGASFNELALNKQNRPHNPMINAGAIMSCALIKLRDKRRSKAQAGMSELEARGWAGARFDYVMERWQELCGGEKPRFSTPVFLSERETADRNFALAYYMREKGAFPADVDLHDVLEFHFQCCSIEVTAEMMSVVAATLANGGICPISGVRVFKTETVQNCLSLMSSCGMYDYSGEFAFTIGLPAKSGVSGAIMIVVPNVMGFCTWSPRLDEHGNSVRGIEFCKQLVKSFNFHNYDILTGASGKNDPRISRTRWQAIKVNELVWAASKGDLGAIEHQLQRGAVLSCADYDLRTPLHLAAAENQAEVVRFFIERKARSEGEGKGENEIDLNPRDRWGGTPLDDAYLHDHGAIIELLEQAGGHRGKTSFPPEIGLLPVAAGLQAESHKTAEMIWATSAGDVQTVYRLVAQGIPLDIADYDLRTPLHLAAAEGHAKVVSYFIVQKAALNPRDRWGNTPLDDARRHGRDDVAALLESAGGKPGRALAG
ncbi:MAG: glutaminase A [Kiloniellales bacterium]|nr:glutaminase A [Kiloniellales bacterium]